MGEQESLTAQETGERTKAFTTVQVTVTGTDDFTVGKIGKNGDDSSRDAKLTRHIALFALFSNTHTKTCFYLLLFLASYSYFPPSPLRFVAAHKSRNKEPFLFLLCMREHHTKDPLFRVPFVLFSLPLF